MFLRIFEFSQKEPMQIHLIAIGGSAMHNLALALHYNHHTVTGSDDEIYNPARDRLDAVGLLPSEMGWHPDNIHADLDFVILGMHARPDNPELLRAQELQVPIYSYPEFLYQHAKDKKRVVIAGSHGKTTTTAMVLHVLQHQGIDTDYLVGAQLEGFERMVRLSDAPLIIIEGDEYLSSPIDRRPKILHYRPHLAVITGIAWDHINVFPTFDHYLEQFRLFIDSMEQEGKLFYYAQDTYLKQIGPSNPSITAEEYEGFEAVIKTGKAFLQYEGREIPLQIFGQHNLENLKAAYLLCLELGISDEAFFTAISSFRGAAKRMQLLEEKENAVAYLDFAHAPSKVKATVDAFKAQFPQRRLLACLELHTFSSLNKTFLQEYAGSLEQADEAIVYYSPHTLKMKQLPPIYPDDIQKAFRHHQLSVYNENQSLLVHLQAQQWENANLLLMTPGTFNGLHLKEEVAKIWS